MGLRFRKSFKIAPGVRVNINKKSVGISAGVKGARVSVNSKGRVTKTVGLPGTGVSYTDVSTVGKKKPAHTGNTDRQEQPIPECTPTTNLPPIDPQPPKKTPKWMLTLIKILAIVMIAAGLLLTVATIAGGLFFTAFGCFMLYYRRARIAMNGDKVPRRRWAIVIAVLFVLLAIGGKSATEPAADTNTTAEQTTQADTEESSAAEEKAAAEQKAAEEKAAAEKAAAEQKAAEEKAAAEKAAAEQKAAEEKAAAEKAAAEQKAAEEKAAAEQAAAAQATAQQQETVYITPSGKRWHRSASCAGDNAIAVTIDQVGSRTPCKKCA